ncbi:hypothetical protein PAPYR_10649 [Paratrimastix pyriformis]|uniref:C2 domain-containing protein n=1 Tax=Paratrimastix pyriformis TaxID=342808 RepID=A0ABQ8U7A1_9EUKA|nr:hypothetical protein PAPYR_10649 [Paratrimastix pyriformis]
MHTASMTAGSSLGGSVMSSVSTGGGAAVKTETNKQQDLSQLLEEEEIRPLIYGILAFRIVEARKIITEESEKDQTLNAYCKISIQDLSKRTKVAPNINGRSYWNQVKHFPVQISRSRRHPSNLVRIQVFSFKHANEKHKEYGTVAFHLHDIARALKFKGKFDLFLVDQIVGEIQVSITFHYGLFGFGYSLQLKKKDQVQPPDWFVRHSLFPRLQPPTERAEPGRGVMLPKATCHPYCVPFDYRVFLGDGREIAPKLDWAAAAENRFPNLMGYMKDFSHVRHAMKQISSRHEKLQFLRDVIASSSKRLEMTKEEPSFRSNQPPEKPYMKYMRPVSGVRKFALTVEDFADLDLREAPSTARGMGEDGAPTETELADTEIIPAITPSVTPPITSPTRAQSIWRSLKPITSRERLPPSQPGR